jgi:hypothetical protein
VAPRNINDCAVDEVLRRDRLVRAMESQAQSLKSIAASLKKIERCK